MATGLSHLPICTQDFPKAHHMDGQPTLGSSLCPLVLEDFRATEAVQHRQRGQRALSQDPPLSCSGLKGQGGDQSQACGSIPIRLSPSTQ